MKIPLTLFVPAVSIIYRLWCSTLRISQEGREMLNKLDANNQGGIIVLWHCEMFGIIAVREKLRLGALVSPSRDGSFLAGILQRLGLKTVAGSSSRGGTSALRAMLSLIKKDALLVCVTPDGPRGPALKVKSGVIFMAMQSKAPIIPMRMFAQKGKRFSSWDKFILPLPFSRVHIKTGEPYYLNTQKMDAEELEKQCRVLEEKMQQLANTGLPFTNYV